jgi:hypothetical protein
VLATSSDRTEVRHRLRNDVVGVVQPNEGRGGVDGYRVRERSGLGGQGEDPVARPRRGEDKHLPGQRCSMYKKTRLAST